MQLILTFVEINELFNALVLSNVKRYIKMIANSSKIKQKKELQKYTIYEKNVGVWKCAFTTLLTILMCRILHNVRSLMLQLSQLVLLE